MTRLLLLDDHALIRRGMREALGEAGFEVAGDAGSWDELVPLLPTGADVLLLDIALPGASGLEVLELLKGYPAAPRALMVSMYPEDPYAVKAIRAGAWGYVNKSADTADLLHAIGQVAQGHRHVPAEVAKRLAQWQAVTGEARVAPHDRLSGAERHLLVLLACGRRLPDIAEQLGLPPKTVSVYRARLLEKLKLAGNAELAQYARRQGLVMDAGVP